MIGADEQIETAGTDVFALLDLNGHDLISTLQNEIQFGGVAAFLIVEVMPICGQLLRHIVFRDSAHESVPLAG